MKRNVLASFTNVLLLPVTIVPRTVGAFVTTSSTAAVNGISMLNPQRWGAQTTNGYSADFTRKNGDFYLDNAGMEEEEKDKNEYDQEPCMSCFPCLTSVVRTYLSGSIAFISCNTRRSIFNDRDDRIKSFRIPWVIFDEL